jgi:hypothetical protein
MEFMLFLMFFTSPPAAKAHPVWTLHSTAQFQFSSMPACIKYGQLLQNRMDTTDTVKMRGWCVDQGSGNSTYAAPNPHCKDFKSDDERQANGCPRVGGDSAEIVPKEPDSPKPKGRRP